MSRIPPYPDRRGRSPSQSNGSSALSPTSAAGLPTRPLQIGRTTPSNNGLPPRANTPQGGPSRPQRSELRGLPDERNPGSNRDSIGTSYSDYSNPYSRPVRNGTSNTRSRPPRSPEDTMMDQLSPTSPTSPPALTSALSAFQSAGRRRARTHDEDELEYQRERQLEKQEEALRQQRIQGRAPGRRVNGRARPGDIDSVLDQIRDGWEFVIEPDFNSVDLALQLLDDSSMGKDMDSFIQTKNVLSRALKGSVNKHYEAFAASLPHHASLLHGLDEIQGQIDLSRGALQESKDALGTRRTDLMQLWSRGQTLEEMMRILDQIEHLKTVPDLLETLMSEKRLLHASVLLIRSLKMINKSDMMEIGAVADLRAYLTSQESALRDILIDELHSHLYLKSFWCEARWSSYTPNQTSFSKIPFDQESDPKTPLDPTSPSSSTFRRTRLGRFLHDLTLRPNDPPIDMNDLGHGISTSTSFPSMNIPQAKSTREADSLQHPESDSFLYMESVLESIAVLGKLGTALDTIAQRLSGEIYNLVETTLDEVTERMEYGRERSLLFSTGSARSESVYVFATPDASPIGVNSEFVRGAFLRLSALEASSKQSEHEILRDFFWTLYSKLDAVAQGLRVTYEVANRIGSRRDFKDSSGSKPGSLFPLEEAWLAVQAEIRTLIYDYLSDEEQGTIAGRNPIAAINDILRDGKWTRDKTKSVFRFADTDAKYTSKVLRPHEDELTRALKDTMPGLVQASTESTVQAALSTVGTDDRLLGANQHHRLLISPDAFHVSVLFQPTLAFLEHIQDILPSELHSMKASSGAVLDEFVLRVYLPQLEEKVSLLFHHAVAGPDAFLIDTTSNRLSARPLVKSSTELMALINSLKVMLQVSPFHRENYSRLILGVIIQYYQRCSDRFQDLTSSIPLNGDEPEIALAAQWAQQTELTPCLSELLISPSDLSLQQQLCKQETNLELGFLGQKNLTKSDLVPSVRNLAGLASLYHSISWFAAELGAIKPKEVEIPPTPQVLEPMSAVSAAAFQLHASAPDEQFNLPLSKEMGLRYQALVKTFEQLADLILVTLRIDMRCRTIFHLESSLRVGSYSIDREAGEPDPHVIDLNTELTESDEMFSNYVPPAARQFIFVGLGHLMEHILISSARHLKQPTAFGIKKILRNILALQQGLKTITTDRQNSEFERAKTYFNLFFISPQEMLNGIRKRQIFSFDDYQLMLSFQCGVDPSTTTNGSNRTSKATDRNYSMYVIDLHGLELEDSA